MHRQESIDNIVNLCSISKQNEQEAQLMLTTCATRLGVSRSQLTNMVPFWVRCDFSLSTWPPPRVTTV